MAKTRKPPKSAEPAEIAQTADLVLLNRKDAATALGLSDRRVHEFGQQGLLTQHEAIDPVTGRKSVMFDQAEVERLAAERATAEDGRRVAAQRRRIAAAQVRSGALVSPATIAPGAIVASQIASGAVRLAQLAPGAIAAPPPAAPWITLQDAAEYTGLSIRLLARLVAEGTLPALDEGKSHGAWGRWRVKRAELDALTGACHSVQNA